MKKMVYIFLLLFIPMLIVDNIQAQTYDRLSPPFPRTGIFNMASAKPGNSHGTRELMLKDYDMVIIYGMTDFGGDALAQILRNMNPNQIILASGINSVNDRDPIDYFLYRSYRGTLLEPVEPNQSLIRINDLTDIHAGQADPRLLYIRIDDDLIKVTRIEDDTTVLVETGTNPRLIADAHHDAGATVYSVIRVSGPGIYPNFSEYTTAVDGKYVWEYIAEENYLREVDWTSGLFDGMFHDWFTYFLYIGNYQHDFDMNGINDKLEHSDEWIGRQWHYGLDRFVQKEVELMNQLTPGLPNLYGVNAGGVLDVYYEYMNGHQFEGFQRFTSVPSVIIDANKWMNQGQKPTIMHLFDYFAEKHFYNGKNRFNKVRFGLTLAMMFDMYYCYAAGDTYYLFYWYDEFETDMGYPTGPYSTLSNGLLVRYFDKGVAISNPTGADQLLTADMLTGGPYYRLQGGQDPVFNNGELFTQQNIYGYDYGPKNRRGDGMLLFKDPTIAVADIIVDNFFMNATSPGSDPVELTGSWSKAVSKGYDDFTQNNPYWSQTGSTKEFATDKYYYDDSWGYHVSSAGTGENSAVWKPTIGLPGWYEVCEWHGWHGDAQTSYDEATNVPFEIGVGTEIRIRGTIDQQVNIGQWNRLGYINLPAGKEGFVKVTNNANGYVIADAMRFRYMGGEEFVPDSVPPASPTNVRVY